MFLRRRNFFARLAWLFGGAQLPELKAAEKPSASPSAPAPARGANPTAVSELHKADYDLIVVGGGISGTAAAISAARNGMKVALVHERSMLGGNSSSEVRLYPENNDHHQPWIKESGIHDEFHTEERARNHVAYREGLMNCHWDLVLYEWVIREKNISLFLNTHMHQVRMD